MFLISCQFQISIGGGRLNVTQKKQRGLFKFSELKYPEIQAPNTQRGGAVENKVFKGGWGIILKHSDMFEYEVRVF